MPELGLPVQPVLAEDLGGDGEFGGALEQAGADDDLGAEDGLVVVDVRGAVGAVVAVYGLACLFWSAPRGGSGVSEGDLISFMYGWMDGWMDRRCERRCV